jgi:hypothetical protein
MELIQAVKEEDVEKVKVRRPLEAVSGSDSGPSWSVVSRLSEARSVDPRSRRRTPDSALQCRISPLHVTCIRRRSGNIDAACRLSSVLATTPRFVTRTLPCHIAESPNFSPPPSPRNCRFHDFPKFGMFDGCASGERAGECSESSRSTLCR